MKISNLLSLQININNLLNNKVFYSIILSFIAFLIIKIAKKIAKFLFLHLESNQKSRYLHNQKYNIFLDVFLVLSWYVIWSPYLSSLITIISFMSAAITLALREVIYDIFAGLYINIKKPFSIEDRIEIKGIIGDVVNINFFSFEVLEINQPEFGLQSTGKIINFPNSYIFSDPIKNYVKEFKYIWDEIVVRIPLDSDVKKAKNCLYKIVNENEIISSIPKKMEKQIDSVSIDYRIYFNKLKPIIYTKVVENHIELSIRFLCHPKKIRIVENELWLNILDSYKKGKINLYKD